ncbi:MAG: hypothetical protein LAT64_10970 [Phycisphaerales bacterium]|nr:hypothetical protein [Planctomycetota bacterium]MCH8509272.1 hypothetical protein [Phycisphaerales bacterium]
MKVWWGVSVFALASFASAQVSTPLVVKQVAAPPSDIETGVVVLPDPAERGVASRSALLEVDLIEDPATGRWSWSAGVSVGARGAQVAFLPSIGASWSARIVSPGGRAADADGADVAEGAGGVWHDRERLAWSGSERLFDALAIDGAEQGDWRIEIESDRGVNGFVLVATDGEVELYTHRDSYSALAGEPVRLFASFSDGSRPRGLHASVRAPSGASFAVRGDPASGLLSFTPDEPGAYAVRVEAEGVDAAGDRFVLTTQHLVDVAEPADPLGGVRVDTGDERVVFEFQAQSGDRRVILASEVWGERDGAMVPVCWLARVCGSARSLAMDTRWLSMAGVDPATVELRRTRVHDVNSMNLLELVERMPAPAAGVALPPAPDAPTRDMLVSASPEAVLTPLDPGRGVLLPPGHRLLLVHGYCAPGNPFPTAHFSGSYAAFNDPGANRSHDEFALEILAQTAQMKSFGVAAHSQGSLASLHLYNFYFSGMDWARGARLIQTVGAPYQGTPLAGLGAVLGDVFGVGCGVNPNLTYLGAAAWLSTIPTSSRQNVWYWRTTFEVRPFVVNYCSLITRALLNAPEDGVVEAAAGVLPGATNMGLKEGWCHTNDMRDPQQTRDAQRNAQINQTARR